MYLCIYLFIFIFFFVIEMREGGTNFSFVLTKIVAEASIITVMHTTEKEPVRRFVSFWDFLSLLDIGSLIRRL